MIGSTTHKGNPKDNILPKVLTDADADMKTLDELRGLVGNMKEGYENLHTAKLSLNEKATVAGCIAEVQTCKQKMEMLHEQMQRLIGMYGTLQGEVDEFKAARIRELTLKVNGGSTTPEDADGSYSKPSN